MTKSWTSTFLSLLFHLMMRPFCPPPLLRWHLVFPPNIPSEVRSQILPKLPVPPFPPLLSSALDNLLFFCFPSPFCSCQGCSLPLSKMISLLRPEFSPLPSPLFPMTAPPPPLNSPGRRKCGVFFPSQHQPVQGRPAQNGKPPLLSSFSFASHKVNPNWSFFFPRFFI